MLTENSYILRSIFTFFPIKYQLKVALIALISATSESSAK